MPWSANRYRRSSSAGEAIGACTSPSTASIRSGPRTIRKSSSSTTRLRSSEDSNLTFVRWDTPAHDADDARRLDAEGKISRPMHDVQVAVDGATAAALGDLVRARWLAATGAKLAHPPRDERDVAA